MARKKDEIEQVTSEEDDLIQDILSDLNKKNPETAMLLESSTRAQAQGWIPSGCIDLDNILGGGYPLGRIVEVYGAESNGKSTVAMHAVAEVQKMGGVAVYFDTEHAMNKQRAKEIGINLSKLIYAQPSTMEEVFEQTETIIEKVSSKSDRPILIVWDSVASTPVQAELDGAYDDQFVGVHGRVMSQALRKINAIINHSKTCFMAVNQTRDKVGVMFGNKTTTPGGKALKFYASIRLEVVKIGQYKEGNEVAGIKCIGTATKNKLYPPFGKANFNILFDSDSAGIDTIGNLLDSGYEKGIFGNSKGWYLIDDKKMRKADARKYLKENPETYQTLYDTISSME